MHLGSADKGVAQIWGVRLIGQLSEWVSGKDVILEVLREVAGQGLYQAYLGSSANPGYRDFAIAALMVRGRKVASSVSLDVNPTSRQLLENLIKDGLLIDLVRAGARLHQAGCNGCIGMGQAPASGRNSLRTVPRNFILPMSQHRNAAGIFDRRGSLLISVFGVSSERFCFRRLSV